jgi:hypothetical protein
VIGGIISRLRPSARAGVETRGAALRERRRAMAGMQGTTAIGPAGEQPEPSRWVRARDRVGLVVTWGTWLVMTATLVLYVRHYTRNIPLMDDFDMVSVLTGSEPVTLEWAWKQHHEHRPMISRMILVGLARFVDSDFRTARYANVGLLSAMAAAMLLLARRLRGSSRVTDAVLPLSILNVAQAESLLIGFAMNLILSSLIAIALLVATGLGRNSQGKVTLLGFGLSLVLLPLTGGSGLAMLPPLVMWMIGHIAWGWWSGQKPGALERAIGLSLLLAGAAVMMLYIYGYEQPPYHPLSGSMETVAIGALKYLTLAIYPNTVDYWWPTGLLLLAILTATLHRLATVSSCSPEERPRALALMAIILSMISVAGAVGVSRGGLGSATTILSRYVTLTFPLLGTMYIAWLAYGNPRARVAIHWLLLALMVLAMPDSRENSRSYGQPILVAQQLVEGGLKNHVSTAKILKRACPVLFPDPRFTLDRFRMLKVARFGPFAEFETDPVATRPEPGDTVRR